MSGQRGSGGAPQRPRPTLGEATSPPRGTQPGSGPQGLAGRLDTDLPALSGALNRSEEPGAASGCCRDARRTHRECTVSANRVDTRVRGTEHAHTVVQPSPLSSSRTVPSPQKRTPSPGAVAATPRPQPPQLLAVAWMHLFWTPRVPHHTAFCNRPVRFVFPGSAGGCVGRQSLPWR